jgi:hypothetical protein
VDLVPLAVLEQELALEPIQFGLVAPLPGTVDECQGLVQHLLPLMDLAVLPIRVAGKFVRKYTLRHGIVSNGLFFEHSGLTI